MIEVQRLKDLILIDKVLKVVHEEKEQQFQISAATILSMR